FWGSAPRACSGSRCGGRSLAGRRGGGGSPARPGERAGVSSRGLGSTPDAVSDASLQRVISAAVRLYAAKSEDRAQELAPFGDRPVNATEAVTAICAIMRAADLNFFDLQMWYRRGQRD